jgi:hypothetical protein
MFFRCSGSGAVDSRSRVLTSVPWTGASRAWLHHTRLEVLSPPAWRVQRSRGVMLCALEILLGPHAVLFIRLAERRALASEGRARGRGRPRTPCATLTVSQAAKAGVHSPGQAQGDQASADRRVHSRRRTDRRARALQAYPPRWPVRRQAHPLGSRQSGDICADQRRSCA